MIQRCFRRWRYRRAHEQATATARHMRKMQATRAERMARIRQKMELQEMLEQAPAAKVDSLSRK